MVMVKEEAPEDPTACADLHDPKLLYIKIKEEQEGVFISLGGEQLCGNEEIHAFKFSVTATAIKSEDDKHSPLLLQLHQDQIKHRELPEENNSRESIMIEDHGDGSNSLEPEDTEKDEDYDEAKHPASELTHLSDSGLKTKNMGNEWKESRAPESNKNFTKTFSSSDVEEFVHYSLSLQKHTDSEMGSTSLENKKCLTERKNVDSQRKVQTEGKLNCEDCGKTFTRKQALTRHKKINTGQKDLRCDLCRVRFSCKSYLNAHVRIHTGQKLFCCELCGHRSKQKSHLNTHLRNHTGEKPFLCDICGNGFVEKILFKQTHENSHSTETFPLLYLWT